MATTVVLYGAVPPRSADGSIAAGGLRALTSPVPFRAEDFTAFSNYTVGGVARPIVLLNGQWEIALISARDALADPSAAHWRTIAVPGEALMQGVPIRPGAPFCYRRKIEVPGDYQGCRILLCFDGVYSDARVLVDGREIGSHAGGFTSWAVDVSRYAHPGDTMALLIECTDRSNDVSYASGYAKHPIAGILRDVSLRADPPQRVEDWRAVTTVKGGRDVAEVKLNFALTFPQPGELRIALRDPEGQPIPLPFAAQSLPAGTTTADWRLGIEHARLWTAETPELYTLDVTLSSAGKLVQAFSAQIGLREIEATGEQVLVNGKPVKLRGACRHDIHPLLGRVSTPDFEELDVKLAKEANLNFIRTSHYPPTRHFLELCDREGIYVEVETAVCFVGTHRSPADKPVTQAGPEFHEEILEQIKSMERSARNHASVLIWSIGNESVYDDNIQASYDYLKATDPTRPIIWSYPGTVPEGKTVYDIVSMHYPDVMHDGHARNLGTTTDNWRTPGHPALFDEWAHVACYAKGDLAEDPNMRDFWGASLDRMWRSVFAEPGALGGAIWGMVDETFAMPADLPGQGEWWGMRTPGFAPYHYAGPVIGYGEWGFVDVWRRKKPEFWSVRKAYSPIRLHAQEAVLDPATGDRVLPIENRHDHLDLSGIRLHWSRGNAEGDLNFPRVPPHARGEVRIPASVALSDLRLQAIAADGRTIDEDVLRVEPEYAAAARAAGAGASVKMRGGGGNEARDAAGQAVEPLQWQETDTEHQLVGPGFNLHFSRETGLITAAAVGRVDVLRGGPRLTFRAVTPKALPDVAEPELARGWHLRHWQQTSDGEDAVVTIEGETDDHQKIEFVVRVNPDARMTVKYRAPSFSKEFVREVGVVFDVAADSESMSWEKDSYWTSYPLDHPGRPRGTEPLRATRELLYRENPRQAWWQDDKDFYLLGLAHPSYRFHFTAVARSTRENVRRFALQGPDKRDRLAVIGDGTIATRLEQTDPAGIQLRLLREWDYPNLLWGNAMKQIKLTGPIEGEFVLDLLPGSGRKP